MITIVVSEITPRLEFTCQEIERRSVWKWKLSTQNEHHNLLYKTEEIDNTVFCIKPGDNQLLFSEKLPEQNTFHENGKIKYNDVFFDPLEYIFWELSRCEEYNFAPKDQHGRFCSENTIIPQELIKQPRVDQAVKNLEQRLADFYNWNYEEEKKKVKIVPSFDIDNAFAFRYKPFHIQIGGFLKDILNADDERIRYRISTMMFRGHDPYDTHDDILKILDKNPGHVFFLLGNRSKYDKNIHWKKTELQALVRRYAAQIPVGIHPSFSSGNSDKLFEEEVQRLQSITENEVKASRQHYLRFYFPHTADNLLRNGVEEDHSMVFHDFSGFRAGTAYPFDYFNWHKNKIEKLTFFPVTYMDGTFADYLKCSVDQAIKYVRELHENMKHTGGTLECIWHNETITNFGGRKGWKQLLLETLQL